MVKWLLRLVLLGVVCVAGVAGYQTYEEGYFAIPDLPEGAYVFSFRNGMRGIILDAEVSEPIPDTPKIFRRIWYANPDRKYLGISSEVPPWFEKAWSICTAPTEAERLEIEKSISEDLRRDLAGARLDAVCRINSDGEEFLRGLLYSVPKL